MQQEHPKRGRDSSVRCSGRCGDGNLDLPMASAILEAILENARPVMKEKPGVLRPGRADP